MDIARRFGNWEEFKSCLCPRLEGFPGLQSCLPLMQASHLCGHSLPSGIHYHISAWSRSLLSKQKKQPLSYWYDISRTSAYLRAGSARARFALATLVVSLFEAFSGEPLEKCKWIGDGISWMKQQAQRPIYNDELCARFLTFNNLHSHSTKVSLALVVQNRS